MSFTTRRGSSIAIWQIIAIFILAFLLADHSADATAIKRLVADETILIDQTVFTEVPRLQELKARAVTPTSESASTATLAVASSSTSASLPQPFDTSIGSNFTTQSCPQFFNTFLSDSSFLACYPFSLLLQTSQAFFSAEKSFFKVTQALDATCQVDSGACSKIMANYATQLKQQTNCGQDYAQQNSIVMQAYDGFMSYDVMYQVGCLKDLNGSYCFADSITGISPIVDSYIYYLPLGTSLPPSTKPSCSYCVQNVMNIYAGSAAKSNQLVSKTYNSAAQVINNNCGAGWVTASVKSAANRSAKPVLTVLPLLWAIFIGFIIT